MAYSEAQMGNVLGAATALGTTGYDWSKDLKQAKSYAPTLDYFSAPYQGYNSKEDIGSLYGTKYGVDAPDRKDGRWEDILQGAGTGAKAGAAVGGIVGGTASLGTLAVPSTVVGGAIGAVAGGIGGAIKHGQEYKNQLESYQEGIAKFNADRDARISGALQKNNNIDSRKAYYDSVRNDVEAQMSNYYKYA